MNHTALFTLAVALGLRHGVDPDHIAAIDGLSRLRPSRWNGVYFALGHGTIVTLLAVGVGGLLAHSIGPYVPWFLIVIGTVNLFRLRSQATHHHHHRRLARFANTSPLLLGVLFGAGFETASQLSALVLAADINPWALGSFFSAGMVLVDGVDGYIASQTQSQAIAGGMRAQRASRALGIFVVLSSFSLGGAELLRVDVDRIALPLGCLLFVSVLAIRIWGLRESKTPPSNLSSESTECKRHLLTR